MAHKKDYRIQCDLEKADRGMKTWRKNQSPRLVSIPEGSGPGNKKTGLKWREANQENKPFDTMVKNQDFYRNLLQKNREKVKFTI